jgi:RNA recognition motif-containing protein
MNQLNTTLTEMVKDPISAGILAATGLIGILLGILITKVGSGSRRRSSRGSGESYGDGSCVEIYVGNLSYDMTEAQMRKEFERFGEVKSARIITNRFNSKSKGYGFVEMPNRPEAEAAIKSLHDKDSFGRKLRINEAKNKSHE